MNETKILPGDPKLTAYALGELDGEERAAVEAALNLNPALRATVDEIRTMGTQLEAALAGESLEEAAPGTGTEQVADPYAPPSRGGLLRFPQLYFIAAGLAAACFAVLVALRTPPPARTAAPRQRVYTQIDLTGPSPVAPATEAERPVDANPAPEAATATVMVPRQPEPPVIVPRAEERSALLDQVKKEAAIAKDTSGRVAPPPPSVDAFSSGGLKRAGAATPFVGGQPAAAAPPPAKDGEVVTLQAFEVASSPDARYTSEGTLPGSQIHINGAAPAASKSSVGAQPRQIATAAGNAGRAPQPLPAPAAPGAPEIMPWVPGPAPKAPEVMPWISGPAPAPANTESYADVADNVFIGVTQNPLSTFAIDVDTAGYSNVRRFLEAGRLPPRDAVRIEELVNYFPYSYPTPAMADKRAEGAASAAKVAPFAASMEVADAPWAPTHRLVRIGLKGREVAADARPAANLVFLLDVSGSMSAPNKLPLVKESMRLLVGKLRPDDRVAIVTYAGQSGLALPSTPVAKARDILEALDALTPGGSTNGALGLQLAYDIAKANLVPGGINRVILCTDGDFNVGVTGEGDLVRLVGEKAKSGVALTALGFGMGNLKDRTLEKIADNGNGNYGYIDTRREAEKLLGEQVNGTLMMIAKDVKIQVEFNPAKVASYRLIGYENRTLKQEDFNNDQVDGGEIGAGHTVTALYEIVPVGAADNPAAAVPAVDDLKYQRTSAAARATSDKGPGASAGSGELLTLKLRFKDSSAEVSRKLDFPLTDAGGRFENASADFKFAAAVAAFGMILRESPHKGSATIGDVIAWAAAGAARAGSDVGGYRSEFIDLARKAQALMR